MLTQTRLKELVSYDPETGLFRRLKRCGNGRADGSLGSVDSKGYLWASVDATIYRMHRLAFLYVTGDLPPSSMDVDHINGCRTDNRFANLRLLTRVENMQNLKAPHADNKSGFLGVFFNKKLKRYTSQIRINGRNTHLGVFDTQAQAHEAYLQAKRQHHKGNTL